jgi:hypothetical protein
MRGLVAATAVLGVVVIGGLPVLALTLADSETGSGETVTPPWADRRPGPPPWAHGRDGKPDHGSRSDDQGPDDEARDSDEAEDRGHDHGQPGWARHGDAVPPGWAKHRAGATPHGWAMRTWAHCVADAAAKLDQGEKLDPEAACGPRPEPPSPPGRDR